MGRFSLQGLQYVVTNTSVQRVLIRRLYKYQLGNGSACNCNFCRRGCHLVGLCQHCVLFQNESCCYLSYTRGIRTVSNVEEEEIGTKLMMKKVKHHCGILFLSTCRITLGNNMKPQIPRGEYREGTDIDGN